MYIIFSSNIDPTIFNIGNFAVKWYGAMYAISFIVIFSLIKNLNDSSKPKHIISDKALDSLLLHSVLGIILGGRIGYVLFYAPNWIVENPIQIFRIWEGGMSFHGGILGLIISIAILCRMHKINLLKTLDILSCTAPIGLFFGRIGNFINSELWGKVTNVDWAVIFEKVDHMPRHPTQIYEALGEGLFNFVLLFYLYKKTDLKERPGFLSGLFLINYSVIRIIIENFKDPIYGYTYKATSISYEFTEGQLLCIPLLLIGILLCIFSKRTK